MHDSAPLFDALRTFVERDQAPFYSPGHKGGRTLDPWFRDHIAAIDLNNLPDTDNLHCPEGPILRPSALIADAWGVGTELHRRAGVHGGNIAVALSALQPDEPVLVARNAHKSVLAGLVQVGAARSGSNRAGTRIWRRPRPRRRRRRTGLRRSAAKALWVLHPTYYGTCGDIGALAETCRRHDAKLLVDGAHSPHFAFHPDLPAPGETSGAAATVQSVHKILSGLSQAAVLHVDPTETRSGDRCDGPYS